jgi:8-amino-7-oxononanoate synthase
MNPVHADKVAGYAAALHSLKDDDRLRRLKPRAGSIFHRTIISRWRARRA